MPPDDVERKHLFLILWGTALVIDERHGWLLSLITIVVLLDKNLTFRSKNKSKRAMLIKAHLKKWGIKISKYLLLGITHTAQSTWNVKGYSPRLILVFTFDCM